MASSLVAASQGSRLRQFIPDEPRVMMDLNTTPLIDVMLVLLVMLIITIPPQNHSVQLDLPTGRPTPVEVNPLRNRLDIDPAGVTRWNGQVVNDQALGALLGAVAKAPTQPEVHFKPDAQARYERVDEVLAMAKQRGVAKLGFVGNEAYRTSF